MILLYGTNWNQLVGLGWAPELAFLITAMWIREGGTL